MKLFSFWFSFVYKYLSKMMLHNKIKADSLLFKNYIPRFLSSMGNAFTEQAKVKVNMFYWNRNANEGTYTTWKESSSLPVHRLKSENHLLKRLYY